MRGCCTWFSERLHSYQPSTQQMDTSKCHAAYCRLHRPFSAVHIIKKKVFIARYIKLERYAVEQAVFV
jgi:hypothetical protein